MYDFFLNSYFNSSRYTQHTQSHVTMRKQHFPGVRGVISGVVYIRKSILFAYAGVENVGGMLCLCSFNPANTLTAGYVLN